MSTHPLAPVATIAMTAALLLVGGAALALGPDALDALEQAGLGRVSLERLVGAAALLVNACAVAGVLAGPGSVGQRLIWSVVILLPLGMVAYVALRPRRPARAGGAAARAPLRSGG